MSTAVKQRATEGRGFWSGLFKAGLYKPTQGRVVRQVTFAAAALVAVLTAWEIRQGNWFGWLIAAAGLNEGVNWMLFLVLALVGVWISFRLVNYARFADFLISVEAEMNKVSWPSKTELWRASLVVIFVIFAMAAVLFCFDLFWRTALWAVGIV
ncbi:MAG TPA: preprotein translocase subunit SecE [Pirellulaceae bacterium]|nr:preprotein translocase subunit SecE [Pirellulaceae bacterium]